MLALGLLLTGCGGEMTEQVAREWCEQRAPARYGEELLTGRAHTANRNAQGQWFVQGANYVDDLPYHPWTCRVEGTPREGRVLVY